MKSIRTTAKNAACARAFALLCMTLCAGAVGAQEKRGADDDEKINEGLPIQEGQMEHYSIYSPGDRTFSISLGLLVPMAFVDSKYHRLKNNMDLGGSGSLSYSYYLTSSLFVGGEIQISFNATLGKHFVFLIPISAHVGYQFIYRRFEFPLVFSLGGASQMYNGYDLYGMYVKTQASGYYRFNQEWSFGVNTSFWWLPQWTSEPDKNSYGHFFVVTAAARYHF